MISFGLTARERELLDFIKAYAAAHNSVSPSYAEMGAALGLRSKAGVSRLLGALEERGAIRRLPNRARSIEIVCDISINPMSKIGQRISAYCARTGEHWIVVLAEAVVLGMEALEAREDSGVLTKAAN